MREALGRARGGYETKAYVITDDAGRAISFALAPGQAHELPLARDLVECLPDVPGWVVCETWAIMRWTPPMGPPHLLLESLVIAAQLLQFGRLRRSGNLLFQAPRPSPASRPRPELGRRC